jgi:hypothetical protein
MTNTLCCLVLLLLILAFQGCAEDQPSGRIAVTAPQNLSVWIVTPENTENYAQGVIRIVSDSPWQIMAYDTNQQTAGHMTEWIGTAYGSKRMISPLHVIAEHKVVLPEGGLIQSGPATKGENIAVTFLQQVSWLDDPLETYRIQVTFIGTPVV